MKLIELSSRTSEDWSGRFVDDTNYDVLLKGEPARVLKPDGSTLAILLPKALSRDSVVRAWSILKGYNVKTDNRGTASGAERVMINKQNKVRPEDMVYSGIIGYFERTPRYPYCRACAFNLNEPEKFAQLLPMVRETSALFAQHGGDRYEMQRKIVEASSKDFVIPGTVFTTLTVNKNFRTACHLDAGDLPEGLSCMALFREGIYTGGRLVFPDFRVAAELETGDLIIFDPHEFHGNTPIVQLSKKHTRCTVVFYYREKMKGCKTAAEELERAKRRQLGEPLSD